MLRHGVTTVRNLRVALDWGSGSGCLALPWTVIVNAGSTSAYGMRSQLSKGRSKSILDLIVEQMLSVEERRKASLLKSVFLQQMNLAFFLSG